MASAIGFLFVHPYLLIYSFSAFLTSGQSLIFGTQAFWSTSLSLALISLLFGGLVGLMQGILVIQRLGVLKQRLFWWSISSAVAWAIGYPLGEQFLASLLWHGSGQFPPVATGLIVGTTWCTIGIITGVVLIWIVRVHVTESSPS